MDNIVVQFAKGGFILSVTADGKTTTEVYSSVGKLNKALRAAVENLSLLPKKADDDAE